ncbi:MAG: alpha/beta fold hydrolase [Ilumatobacteraceae bacterium]
MISRRAMTCALLALAMVAGCTSSKHAAPLRDTGDTTNTTDTTVDPPPDSTTDTPAASLDWGRCDDEMVTEDELECATLPVPLDHANPSGDTIDIALVRVPAEDETDRVGAIVFNPGGPGGSGFDYIAQGGTTISSELGLEDFDLIGFDPRGVDRSNGIRCLTDAEQDAVAYLDDTPDTPEEQAALDDADSQFDQACIEKYGDSLRHYSTEQTARDIDDLRIALGDDQISLLGISYGTYLFGMYATLFPDHVRAMVLDSAYEPTGDTIEQEYTTQLVGFEGAFNDWAAWCESSDDCAFRTDDVGSAWDQLYDQLDASPVPADDGRMANQSVMGTATISAMYSDTDWPVLADALAAVRDGDPTALFRLADDYIGRDSDGTYSTIEQSGSIIDCASGLDAPVPDDPEALVAKLKELAPRFSEGIEPDDFTDSCSTMMPDVTPPALAYNGDASIVVVGGTNDPATPFRWAEEMTEAMGPSARLLTYTGEGHGQMLVSSCVTDIEAAVLVDLDLPDEGATCDPDPDIPRPGWWDDLPVPDGVGEIYASAEVNGILGLAPTFAYSELRTSSLAPDDVLDAYDDALEDAGFLVGGRQEPIDGVNQAVYLQSDGEVFSVLAIGHDSMDSPDLEGLADAVPAGQTLIVLLTLPSD